MIGPGSSRATSCDRQCEVSSSPPKRRLTPLGWRLKEGGPTENETSPTVAASGEVHPEISDATSLKRAMTPYSRTPPVEADTVSCSLSLTPSPPPTSTGHSPRRSWTSVLTKHAGGRKMPKATTFFAMLKRSSSPPSREKPDLKSIGRLSSASDMEWACEEPQPEALSVGISAALVDPNADKDRRDVYVHGDGDDTDLLQVHQVQLAADPYEVSALKPMKISMAGTNGSAPPSAVERVLKLERFVNVTAEVLGRRIFFGASFEEALNRALPNGVPVHTADTVVSVRCLSEMRATMAAVATKPHTAYVYTSLVLVAQVKDTFLY
ncbi:hypothetical protein V5799_022775 [Amblyomma americanum]|uniref:Uncharacterized protein n=1 Tax=Amblyomma americanum TaxID=6943 RepID=A0AAQ4FJS4_AMBAM